MFKKTLFACTVLLTFSCSAQEEVAVWEDFKTSKKNGQEPILPDFSYAGYKYSEVPIPDVDFKMFNVLDYGAIGNDTQSDKSAIIKAITAAEKNGSGIIYFPNGKYYINTVEDDIETIKITKSKIVFRGEDEKSTILFFEKDLPPTDPDKLWTSPRSIELKTKNRDKLLTRITANAARETFEIMVEDASQINEEDWITIQVLNNDKNFVEADVAPLKIEKGWNSIIQKGVQVNERHKVRKVQGNVITLYEPIHYTIDPQYGWEVYSFTHTHHNGFENMTFEGNWTKKFVHHKSAQHDGGWSILKLARTVDSWIQNCTFKNVNNAADFSSSAASTALNITIEGNYGHAAIHAGGGSTGILLAKINDLAGMHHATGVGGGSTTGTVVWRSKHPAHTSFESHASQPRCTLFDNVEGGFFQGRAGGARQNLPNHSKYLVLWNYNETDEAETDFRFVATDTWFWRIVPPIIVGFHGSGTTFNEKEVSVLESVGTPVKPESLFEEQLKLRLGKLPEWLAQEKRNTF